MPLTDAAGRPIGTATVSGDRVVAYVSDPTAARELDEQLDAGTRSVSVGAAPPPASDHAAGIAWWGTHRRAVLDALEQAADAAEQLGADNARLRAELEVERAQHRANVAGLESALATAEHERSTVEAALARLRDSVPACAHCGERPAACFGRYESEDHDPAPACDECCGHGNEDGWCVPIADLPGWAVRKADQAGTRVAELEMLLAGLGSDAPVGKEPPPERETELATKLRRMDTAQCPLLVDAGPNRLYPDPTPGDEAAVQQMEGLLDRRVSDEARDLADRYRAVDAARIAELETALRGLVARVERTGGYADPADQDALWRARQALTRSPAPPAPLAAPTRWLPYATPIDGSAPACLYPDPDHEGRWVTARELIQRWSAAETPGAAPEPVGPGRERP